MGFGGGEGGEGVGKYGEGEEWRWKHCDIFKLYETGKVVVILLSNVIRLLYSIVSKLSVTLHEKKERKTVHNVLL